MCCVSVSVLRRAAKLQLLISIQNYVCRLRSVLKEVRTKKEAQNHDECCGCVCLIWGRNTAPCLKTKSARDHHYKAVCFVCKAEQWVAACLLSSCSFKLRKSKVCECMKDGISVEAPDLLTQLHLYAQECTEGRKTEKKGVQVHAECCVCASLGEETQPHALPTKCAWGINTELCVFGAMQSCALQLDCSPLAHSNIETQICVV